jgi:sphingomyelin phosphodiesterase acid-like 3
MRKLGLLLCLLLTSFARAQTVPVVMLSDLHFDPLRDPGKTARLAAAPESDWPAILQAPATATQAADFAAIQAKCGTRSGLDSDYPLLASALHSAAAQTPSARFVTVSGDLVVHQFECRWKLASGSSEGYADFAEKTTSFVVRQVEAAFPGIPVYFALGNNDSSCGDYRMDLHDRYFAATAAAVLDGLPKAARKEAAGDYATAGYFSAPIPGVPKARLLAIDDIYLARKYQTCAGKPDRAPAAAVLGWLGRQLEQAKARGEAVWILAHIPPGVDVYSTVTKGRDVCAGEAPELFLADEAFATLLARYPETIRMIQFGHTHSDEVRLVGEIPAKIIGSVTPINGNLPSFTVGLVDGKTARLLDYTVYTAADKTGSKPWSREYNYRETYGSDVFTAAALRAEIAGFRKDPDSAAQRSKAYEQSFFPGSPSPLALVWPQAACTLGNVSAASYRACVCKQP